MKKVLAVLFVFIFCLSLCACGEKGGDVESIEDKVKQAVESDIMVEIVFNYDTTGVPSITYFVEKISETEYEVTGKVTVKDKYGDAYTGKYDAVVTYDPVKDDCSADVDMGKLYKD